MSSFPVFDSKGGEIVGPKGSPIITKYKSEWSKKGRIVDYGVRGRLKSIMPLGDKLQGQDKFTKIHTSVIF